MRSEDDARASAIQRIENAAVAVAILVAVIVAGGPWWLLFALFLVFDLSAVGYLRSPRLGALTYNLVHSYVGPALIAVAYLVLAATGIPLPWLLITAACWAFHVAVDRAIGYGLKLQDASHTHLGPIGPAKRAERSPGA